MQRSIKRLREFTLDYVSGDLPDLDDMRYTRVDYCHNFALGDLLADYVATLSRVCYLTHRRTTNGSGGVEWWNGGRRVRVYDKHREILEKEKKAVPIAKGTLRLEHQIRKQSGLLERQLKDRVSHVFECPDPYACLQEPGRNTAQDVSRHSFSDERRRQKRSRFGIFLSKGDAVTWGNSAAHDRNNRGDKTPFITEHFLRGQARS